MELSPLTIPLVRLKMKARTHVGSNRATVVLGVTEHLISISQIADFEKMTCLVHMIPKWRTTNASFDVDVLAEARRVESLRVLFVRGAFVEKTSRQNSASLWRNFFRIASRFEYRCVLDL